MKLRAATAVVVAALFGAIGSSATDQSGVFRTLTVILVGALAGLATIKFFSRATRWSDDWWDRLPFVMIGAIAVCDGFATLLGGRPFADWSIGVWSLPLGLIVLSAEAIDFRRPAPPPPT